MVVMIHAASVQVLSQNCSLVSGHNRFGGIYCFYSHGKRAHFKIKKSFDLFQKEFLDLFYSKLTQAKLFLLKSRVIFPRSWPATRQKMTQYHKLIRNVSFHILPKYIQLENSSTRETPAGGNLQITNCHCGEDTSKYRLLRNSSTARYTTKLNASTSCYSV